jgi:hypothetical protein
MPKQHFTNPVFGKDLFLAAECPGRTSFHPDCYIMGKLSSFFGCKLVEIDQPPPFPVRVKNMR